MAEQKQEPMNDRREGMLRDPVVWRKGGEGDGEIVSYVKDVGNGDPGYNATVRQVLIMKQDGTEQVVPESEITRQGRRAAPPPSHVLDRRPDQTFPPDLPEQGDAESQNRQARPPASEAGPQSGRSNPTSTFGSAGGGAGGTSKK